MYKLFIKKTKDSKSFLESILNKYHIKNDICYNEYGKPYIKGNPIYFNISHSKEYTVIAISDQEIGVDIEHLTYKKKLLNKIANEEEIKAIKNEHDWTKLWVKKESYVKYLGMGLSYGLKNVDTINNHNFRVKKYKKYYICVYKEK